MGTHDMEHPAPHDHSHHFRTASHRSLWIAMAITAPLMAAELVGGLLANSLALVADAAHMATDVAAIGLALFAMWLAARPGSYRRTFGYYRAEVIAALCNALSLWLIAAWIFVEAYQRFTASSEIQGNLTLIVGAVGLVANVAAAWALQRASSESINVEGALLHVLGDLVGSVGVIIAAALVMAFGWHIADPITAAIIGVLILFSSGRLLWKVIHVLIQGAPANLDLEQLCRSLEQVEGVTGIHDIHAWTVTTGYHVFSAHVTMEPGRDQQRASILHTLRETVSVGFGVSHVTIQLEDDASGCIETHHVPHTV
jgi:cobalt-zinc-cadmium efflux system protein